HPVIVHRLLEGGPQGFNALQESVDGISSKVLSDSLDDLEDAGLVDRAIISEKPFRVEYSLTERGADLEPVVEAMREWGQRHLMPAGDRSSSVI
ncbi:MAG: helix-turn-helix domain-containing protein, partial [Haloarculaceae archaeon]